MTPTWAPAPTHKSEITCACRLPALRAREFFGSGLAQNDTDLLLRSCQPLLTLHRGPIGLRGTGATHQAMRLSDHQDSRKTESQRWPMLRGFHIARTAREWREQPGELRS